MHSGNFLCQHTQERRKKKDRCNRENRLLFKEAAFFFAEEELELSFYEVCIPPGEPQEASCHAGGRIAQPQYAYFYHKKHWKTANACHCWQKHAKHTQHK